MREPDLQTRILDYQSMVKLCAPLHKSGDRVMRSLCWLYAVKYAKRIVDAIAAIHKSETVSLRNDAINHQATDAPGELPIYEQVLSASQGLIPAIASKDQARIREALDGMGVSSLCPSIEKRFEDLEQIADSFVEHVRLILSTEMAIMAVELLDYKRASKYSMAARTLAPGAPELHDLFAVDGLVALSEDRVAVALGHLNQSVEVCLDGEYARLECRIRPPNVALAASLLDRGETEEVVSYLTKCLDVWERNQEEIAAWIHSIKAGQRPLFLASGLLGAKNHPAIRVRYLYARAGGPHLA